MKLFAEITRCAEILSNTELLVKQIKDFKELSPADLHEAYQDVKTTARSSSVVDVAIASYIKHGAL